MYYRVAIQVKASPTWQWQSTALKSQSSLWRWLQFYRAFPRERLRIFSSPSREELNEQIARENQGLRSLSVPATQFLQERGIVSREVGGQAEAGGTQANKREVFAVLSELSPSTSGASLLDKRREDLERGAGGDYDTPYQFELPLSMPQVLAWLKLQARVQQGELQGEIVACRNGELLWRKEDNS
jgi:hypothetical protein